MACHLSDCMAPKVTIGLPPLAQGDEDLEAEAASGPLRGAASGCVYPREEEEEKNARKKKVDT